MKILVVGSGGREHALAWKLAQSARVTEIFCAPGNAGTEGLGRNVSISAMDVPGLLEFARRENIDLTVVGPDDALALGIADVFEDAGFVIFGPRKAAARLESSKSYAKEFMRRHGIPTAASETFHDIDTALAYCTTARYPLVVKADGLALGKGVIIAQQQVEAERALRDMMQGKVFGDAGSTVLIEEFIEGVECSIHAFIDGKRWLLCPDCKDHKRVGEGDTGPNTGGMGTISPSGLVDETLWNTIKTDVLDRFVSGCRQDGIDFRGMLFPGLMLTSSGPRVLEFNCRFGDPETQVLMRRLDSDLVDLLEASATGRLDGVRADWSPWAAACIVMASGGYPGSYGKGFPIAGVWEAEVLPEVRVFHAGTARQEAAVVTAGGRVLGVTAIERDLASAVRRAYEGVDKISFHGGFCRRDIGGGIAL